MRQPVNAVVHGGGSLTGEFGHGRPSCMRMHDFLKQRQWLSEVIETGHWHCEKASNNA